jgi:hypothetical protein
MMALKNGSAGRKFFLFLVVVALITLALVIVAIVGTVTEKIVLLYVGSCVALYLVYVLGNVLTKVTWGTFSADLQQKPLEPPKG